MLGQRENLRDGGSHRMPLLTLDPNQFNVEDQREFAGIFAFAVSP